MPRAPRIYVEGALYNYVTAASAVDVPLFCDQRDYQTYLGYLKEYQARFGFKLYAFLLLPCQLQLCLEPMSDTTISTIVHALNSRYSKYATKHLGRSGHLFQGRFQSTLLEKETMLLPVTGFLHRYPQALGACDDARLYQWSSLPAYLDGSRYDTVCSPHVEVAEVLQRLGEEEPGVDYATYLQSFSEEECRRLDVGLHQTAVGSEAFLALVRRYQSRPAASGTNTAQPEFARPTDASRWRHTLEAVGWVVVEVAVTGLASEPRDEKRVMCNVSGEKRGRMIAKMCNAPSRYVGRVFWLMSVMALGCAVVVSSDDVWAKSAAAPIGQGRSAVESASHEPEQERVEDKMLTGEVSGVGGRFLSVEYERSLDGTSAQDMGFQLDEETVLVGVDQLKALGLGDRVSVSYQEFTRQDEQGDVAGIRRVPTRVSLISKAVSVVQQEPVDGAATATP